MTNGAMIVTLPPLKYLVREIIGDDFPIEVMLPSGASPETYEPVPQQLIAAEKAQLIFTTGLLDFENTLVGKIGRASKVVNLSGGITLIAGNCDENQGHAHGHGVDPHIWASPKELIIMAKNIYNAIAPLYPDSTKYTDNYNKLTVKLNTLDSLITNKLQRSGARCFLIYHPALTYYARDYGLTQISIEDEGKEPSATKLKALIITAKEEKIDKIFYQRQFSQAVVQSIAAETGARMVEIDPLKEDAVANIIDITSLIAGE